MDLQSHMCFKTQLGQDRLILDLCFCELVAWARAIVPPKEF